MDDEMDRVCANCGIRYGDHFSALCPAQESVFIDSGRLMTKTGDSYTAENTEKNPNLLFKRKDKI